MLDLVRSPENMFSRDRAQIIVGDPVSYAGALTKDQCWISAGPDDSNIRYRLDSNQTVDAEADLSLIVMFIFAGDPASDAGTCTGDQCCTR